MDKETIAGDDVRQIVGHHAQPPPSVAPHWPVWVWSGSLAPDGPPVTVTTAWVWFPVAVNTAVPETPDALRVAKVTVTLSAADATLSDAIAMFAARTMASLRIIERTSKK